MVKLIQLFLEIDAQRLSLYVALVALVLVGRVFPRPSSDDTRPRRPRK